VRRALQASELREPQRNEWVDATHAAVFVPGAPDPKSGSVYLIADDRFKIVDVPIREAMKCIKGLGLA
jgi:uncharacterized membrane protein